MEATMETQEMPADSDQPPSTLVDVITLDQNLKKINERVTVVERKTAILPHPDHKIAKIIAASVAVILFVGGGLWTVSATYTKLNDTVEDVQKSVDSLTKRMTSMEEKQGAVREQLAALNGEIQVLRQRAVVEHHDAGASPTYPRLYWCQLHYITERRWRGVDTIIDATRTWRFLAVPGRGLFRPEAVSGQGPATGYSVTIERTAWGFGPGGTDASVRMGLRADIDGQRYCYEYTGTDLVTTPCRENAQ